MTCSPCPSGKKKKKEKNKERRKKITICTGSSFSSKNTHGLQVVGYQVLWLGERPKCTEKGWSARRQHRKTQPAPKHTRAEHSEAWWEAESFTSHCSWRPGRRARAPGFQVHSLAMCHFPPPPQNIRNAYHAILKSGWMNYFLTIVSSFNSYISRSSSFELPLTRSCRIFYLTPMKTTEKL